MKIKQMLEEALRKGEFIEFLRGENGYMVEYSEFVPNAYGTDVDEILMEGIYEEYKENKEIKRIFEQGLLKMLDMTDFDIYKVCDYLMSYCFTLKHKRNIFELEKEQILRKLSQEIQNRKLRIQRNGFVTLDNYHVIDAWRLIEDFEHYLKEALK